MLKVSTVKLEDFDFVNVSVATAQPSQDGAYSIYINRHWETYKGQIMLFDGKYPQCNRDRRLMEKCKSSTFDTEIVFLERVYLPYFLLHDDGAYV